MYDAVLREQERELGSGTGLALALLVHAVAFGAAIAFLPRAEHTAHFQDQIAVTVFTALAEPPPPPPPPAGPAAAETAPSRPVVHPRTKVVEPKPVEVEPKPVEPKPVEPERVEPEPAAEAPEPSPTAEPPSTAEPASGGGGVAGGVTGGVAGGTVGGVLGGVVGGTGTQVLPFGPGMTRPQQIAGTPPAYSREALAARVEGKVLVRCVIETSSQVDGCQVIKGVPLLTEIVLDALRVSRFTPVHYQGRPQPIQYLFTFNFKLP